MDKDKFINFVGKVVEIFNVESSNMDIAIMLVFEDQLKYFIGENDHYNKDRFYQHLYAFEELTKRYPWGQHAWIATRKYLQLTHIKMQDFVDTVKDRLTVYSPNDRASADLIIHGVANKAVERTKRAYSVYTDKELKEHTFEVFKFTEFMVAFVDYIEKNPVTKNMALLYILGCRVHLHVEKFDAAKQDIRRYRYFDTDRFINQHGLPKITASHVQEAYQIINDTIRGVDISQELILSISQSIARRLPN